MSEGRRWNWIIGEGVALAVFALALMGNTSASSQKTEVSTDTTNKVTATSPLEAPPLSPSYLVITFDKGSYTLSEKSKRDLQSFVDRDPPLSLQAQFEVAAWSDHTMSHDKNGPSNADQSLADKRIEGITNFLMSRHVSHIKGFNLAYYSGELERPAPAIENKPSSLHPAQNESQVILKSTIATLPATDVLRPILRRGGPSKAIVTAKRQTIHN